jgi:hypothetical protein
MNILNLTGVAIAEEHNEYLEYLRAAVIKQPDHTAVNHPAPANKGLIYTTVSTGRRSGHQSGHFIVAWLECEKRNQPVGGGYSANGYNHPEMNGAPGELDGVKFIDGRVYRKGHSPYAEKQLAFGNGCDNWIWS